MLARALRLILGCELTLYLVVGYVCVSRYGVRVSMAGIGALVVFLSLRLGLVLFSFIVTRASPPGRGSGIVALPRLVFAEWLTIVGAYTFTMAFPSLFAPRERRGPGQRVLLVHGYLCNAAIWQWFAGAIAAGGHSVHTVTLEPVLGDIEDQAAQLATRIARLDLAPGECVVLVAHSMGGLVARAYVRKYGAAKIAKLITCGTPHQGTVLAPIGFGRGARQMEIGNAWLAQLLADVGTLAAIPEGVVTVLSYDDNLVAPQDTATVPGAKVVSLVGLSHTAMPYSRRIRDVVLAELSMPQRLQVNPAHQIG